MTIQDKINEWYDGLNAITTCNIYSEYTEWARVQVEYNNSRSTLLDYIVSHISIDAIKGN